MKVLHLISGLRSGGAEHIVFELSKRAKQEFGETTTAVLSGHDEIAWKFQNAGLAVYQPFPGRYSLFFKISSVVKCIRYCVSLRPDIIHAHMFHAGIAAVLIKLRLPDSRIVFSLHNSIQPGIVKRLLLWGTSPMRTVDLLFPGHEPKWYNKKLTATVANGIEIKEKPKHVEKNTVFTFLFVGRLEQQKNPLFMVDFALQLKSHARFKIIMVGRGKLLGELKMRIRRHHLADCFELIPFSDKVNELLYRSHVVVVPSLWEGMPLIVLEAGAAGLPVLITPQGNSCGIGTQENSFVAGLHEMSGKAMDIMRDYPNALLKARQLQHVVRTSFTIDHCFAANYKVYTSHLYKS